MPKKNRLSVITVNDVSVDVCRKRMKHLRLSVQAPGGEVKLSAPYFASNAIITNFITERLDWIAIQRAYIASLPIEPVLHYVTGESILYAGDSYTLQVIESNKQAICLKGDKLILDTRANSTPAIRERLINEWYRQQLKILIPELLKKWQPIVGQYVLDWGIRKMKTRWGSCNITDKRICLNLELAKRPLQCLEMVLVHELVHLYEPYHNENFYNLMTRFMPAWREYDTLLTNDGKSDY